MIAETNELPTKYTKIVVTDEHGRFAIPDLPWVRYSVWVRGYGLVDSQKVQAAPGSMLYLHTGRDAGPKEAAEIYPSMCWFSLLNGLAVGSSHACRRTDERASRAYCGGSRIGDPMKSARTDSKPTRTSALGDSWAYATALTRMYADQLDSLWGDRKSTRLNSSHRT